ncbi:MAG: nitronate monooxygenase [Acetobacteraceae bacterium]|nr:nitronate monooxygenase [Acetobacteraceae bacterium]
MPLPAALQGRLSVPAIAAPMFLVSGPDLVIETCKAGVLGTFPTLNQRTTEGYAEWLAQIREALDAVPGAAPFGVNIIVNRSNARVEPDLKATVEAKVPLVITSLGANAEVVQAVHSYGGLVFHDVINMRHAEKAVEAGVDGIIAVCAGAGGHGGTYNPFAFLAELRAAFPHITLAQSGAITNGRQIAAARLLGADLAYIGTRFIATRESMAVDAYKRMVVEASGAKDIVYTPAFSGVHGNYLRPSIIAAGLDPDNLPPKPEGGYSRERRKAWRDIWSGGQGVGSINDIPTVAELCERLRREYREAASLL